MADGVSTTRRLLAARKAWAVVGIVALVGIGVIVAIANKDPRPADFDPPAVAWEEDPEWAGNPWVDAVRLSETLLTYATARGDYTDPDLIAAIGYVDAKANAWGRWMVLPDIDQNAHASQVTKIDIAADGNSAMVATCVWLGELETGYTRLGSATWWVRKLESGHYQAAPALTYGDTVNKGAETGHCEDVTVRKAAWAEPIDTEWLDGTPVSPLALKAYPSASADAYIMPTGYEEGSVPAATDLIWFDGNTQLRGVHPLFDAYLDSLVAQSWAEANNDYSAPEVVSALGYDRASQEAAHRLDSIEHDAPFTPRGRAELVQNAVAMALISVDEKSDGSIVASVCTAIPEYERRDITKNALVELTLRQNANGRVDVTPSHVREDQWRDAHPDGELTYPCDTAIRTFALWPAPIDTFKAHERATVLPRERAHYVELGVIDG